MNRIRQWLKPNLPTKASPHRYCKQVHNVWSVLALLMFIPAFGHPTFFLFIFGLMVVLYFLERIAWKGKTLHERFEDEQEQESLNDSDVAHKHRVDDGAPRQASQRTVFPGGLVVRPGWANVALGMDLFFVLVLFLVVIERYVQPSSNDYALPHATWSGFIGIAVGVGLLWFHQYAHRKATDTRRPRKQWFGLFGTVGSEA